MITLSERHHHDVSFGGEDTGGTKARAKVRFTGEMGSQSLGNPPQKTCLPGQRATDYTLLKPDATCALGLIHIPHPPAGCGLVTYCSVSQLHSVTCTNSYWREVAEFY